jgi:hypothetical protein
MTIRDTAASTSTSAVDAAAPTTNNTNTSKPEAEEPPATSTFSAEEKATTTGGAAVAADTDNNDSDDAVDDNNNETTAGDDDDDDDVTVILLDAEPPAEGGGAGVVALDWIEQQGPEMEARRRTILLRELQRAQRISCCHFVLLCTIPLVLLIIVLSAILGDNGDCNSAVTYCEYEPRTFTNAFTTRCVCDPIPILRTELDGR